MADKKTGLGAGIYFDLPGKKPKEEKPTPEPAQEAKQEPEPTPKPQRKRRSDYKGKSKKDYHTDTKMIGVRVPLALATLIDKKAKANKQTRNAWLLALLEREFPPTSK